jgi:hypothetical protein
MASLAQSRETDRMRLVVCALARLSHRRGRCLVMRRGRPPAAAREGDGGTNALFTPRLRFAGSRLH